MRHEIDPTLLFWLEDQRLLQRQPTLTALLNKLSVSIDGNALKAWGWRRVGVPRHILTVWAEEVRVDSDGNWEVGVSLIASSNPHYDAGQKEREAERISILHELTGLDLDCKVILMVNRRSHEQEAMGRAASAEFRVLDEELWHVQNNLNSGLLVLRRGRNEIGRSNQPEVNSEPSPGVTINFPDQEARKRVEVAAIAHAKRLYASFGRVESVESENLGYDLAIFDNASDELIFKIEVKGTSGEEEAFFLTRNELREADADRARWRLAIVVDALGLPALMEYSANDMEKRFEMDALAWHCTPKR
jgi:hypothetical protein